MQVFTQSTSVLNLLRGVFMFLIFVSPAKVTKNIARVRNCPDITICTGHGVGDCVSHGVGHGISHRVGHGVGHGVGHEDRHWVGRGVSHVADHVVGHVVGRVVGQGTSQWCRS